MKIFFWGSDELSIPFLETLIKIPQIKLLTVITQPDKPKGRGLNLQPTAVKLFSNKFGLNISTPDNITTSEFLNFLNSYSVDLSIVVSYGKIIPQEIIELHKIGMLNVHFSLLPKYRGAAPIQWSLINGDNTTGVTIFWLDKGMDTGDIFLQKKIEVTKDDNYFSLSKKLVVLGCEMLKECINEIIKGNIVKQPQSGEVSYAPQIKKSQGKIIWSKSAYEIHNLVRALVRWPKAYSIIKFGRKTCNVKILNTKVVEDNTGQYNSFSYGEIIKINNDSIVVQCGNNTQLEILQLQPENKRSMWCREFLCGYRVNVGDRFE